jgi:hypothetical protein
LAYSEILSVIIKVSEFFIPTSPIWYMMCETCLWKSLLSTSY